MSNSKKNLIDIRIERKELKYYITYGEYIILSNLLRKVLRQDKHNEAGNGYFVRSLYFDTVDNRSFEEKMAGLEERSKYRLRIYDTNTQLVKFEIKSKRNNSVIKETAIIGRKDADEIQNGNYELMLKYSDPVLHKAYAEFKKRHYRRVVLIDYFREAFIHDLNGVRIVFDRFLKSTPLQLDIFSNDSFSTQKLRKGLVIMEIKYNRFVPKFLKHMLQIPSFERRALSKYCIGRLDYFEV
ncbi:MAG: polyphosphate polymerase domain-containing protein [Nanoarchaeota archaeon]